MSMHESTTIYELSSRIIEYKRNINKIEQDIKNIRESFWPAIVYSIFAISVILSVLYTLKIVIGFILEEGISDFINDSSFGLNLYTFIMSLGLLAFSSLVVFFLFVMIAIAYKPKFFNKNWPVAFLPVFLFTCVFPIVIISPKGFSFIWLFFIIPVMIGFIIFASNITYNILIHIGTFVCFVFNMPNVISLDNYKASLQSDMEKLENSILPILFSILEKIGGGTLDEIYKEVNKVSNQIEPNILISFLEDHPNIEVINLEGHTLYKYKLAGNGSNMKTIILDEE